MLIILNIVYIILFLKLNYYYSMRRKKYIITYFWTRPIGDKLTHFCLAYMPHYSPPFQCGTSLFTLLAIGLSFTAVCIEYPN